jgi:hypothetical protein
MLRYTFTVDDSVLKYIFMEIVQASMSDKARIKKTKKTKNKARDEKRGNKELRHRTKAEKEMLGNED